MELTDYLRILRKYWVSVVAVFLIGIAVAAAATLAMKPVYTASTALFLSVQSGDTAGELNQGSSYAESQVKSYAQVVTSPIVLQPVIDELGLNLTPEKLADQITATVPINTAIISVEVTDHDAAAAAAIANAIGTQVTTIVESLSPQSADGTKRVTATIIAPASVPTEWTSPRVLLNLALGALVGLLLGFGQAVLRARLDTSVVTEDDVAEVTDRSVVGVIAFDADASAHPLIFEAAPHSVRAESYRRLRTNLQFLELGERRSSVVVTSSIAGEGKTTTALNLASALADAGQSVLLVDADLRRPSLAKVLNLDGTVGLTDVVIGRATLAQVTQPIGRGNLHVLVSGRIPPNPSELLGSQQMQAVLAEATDRYDMVIVDSPPLLPVTDAAVLARECGGALLVIGSGTLARPQLAGAIDSLEAVEADLLGLVLNRLRTDRRGGYGYHQHYYYERQSDAEELKVDESVKRHSTRSVPVSPVDIIESAR